MSDPSPLRIGVLLPASRMLPGVDRDFVAGVRAGFAGSGLEPALALEPIGNAAVKDAVVEKVQRLLLQHRPHVVTGILGAPILRHVTTFFRDARTPLVVNNLGADPLLDGGVPNPWILHNSFNLWQSSYALGYWASRNLGSRACIAAGFHEAGYGIVPAFWKGFTEAGGGTVLATEVTHRESPDEDPSGAARRLADEGPDFVLGLYAGREGVSFVEAYSDLGLDRSLPLVSTPLMLNDRWLSRMGDGAVGVRTAFCWDRGGNGDATTRFHRAWEGVEDEPPDVFGLLGYETGRLLAEARKSIPSAGPGDEAWLDALGRASFRSPRGEWTLDPRGRHVVTTDLLQEVRRDGDGGHSLATLETLELPDRYPRDHDEYRSQELRPGWINPYLVT